MGNLLEEMNPKGKEQYIFTGMKPRGMLRRLKNKLVTIPTPWEMGGGGGRLGPEGKDRVRLSRLCLLN